LFSAAEAHRLGLVHEVVAMTELDNTVNAIAGALATASPDAVRTCKRLIEDVTDQPITPELIAMTVDGIADIRATAQGKEGVQAFLQKRKPNWLTPI